MNVAILNDSTVMDFLDNEELFDNCIQERFDKLDLDGDGELSRDELRVGFRILPLEYESSQSSPEEAVEDLYNVVFERFDEDKKGAINRDEFKLLMTEILLAMARGIGSFPVQVVLEQDSLLIKAVEHELGRESYEG